MCIRDRLEHMTHEHMYATLLWVSHKTFPNNIQRRVATKLSNCTLLWQSGEKGNFVSSILMRYTTFIYVVYFCSYGLSKIAKFGWKSLYLCCFFWQKKARNRQVKWNSCFCRKKLAAFFLPSISISNKNKTVPYLRLLFNCSSSFSSINLWRHTELA